MRTETLELPVTEKGKKQLICAGCGAEKLITKKLPYLWKHFHDDYFCDKCWHARFILRAVTLEVIQPINITWEELRARLKVMWSETTSCSNWMITQLAIRDVTRLPGDAKLPPPARHYLYPDARIQFPHLPSQSVVAIEQAVTNKYKAKRYTVLWLCQSSLPNFRYPQPFPIHNQSWSVAMEPASTDPGAGKKPIVTARIGDSQVKLRLKASPLYRRQLASVARLVSGEAQAGECAIYQKGDELMCKLVAWLPRKSTSGERSDILTVRSTPDSLLTAVNIKDEKIWAYHGDKAPILLKMHDANTAAFEAEARAALAANAPADVKPEHLPSLRHVPTIDIPRLTQTHRRLLQHWADDSKAEARPDPGLNARRAANASKYHRRINATADAAAAHLVKYAVRRRFAGIRYDDTERSWCPDFVWHRLEARLKTLCDEYGLTFEKSAPDKPETAEGTAKATANGTSKGTPKKKRVRKPKAIDSPPAS